MPATLESSSIQRTASIHTYNLWSNIAQLNSRYSSSNLTRPGQPQSWPFVSHWLSVGSPDNLCFRNQHKMASKFYTAHKKKDQTKDKGESWIRIQMDRKYTYAREKRLGCQSTVWTPCVFEISTKLATRFYTAHKRKDSRGTREERSDKRQRDKACSSAALELANS